MKAIGIFFITVLTLSGCSQPKETFSLDCDVSITQFEDGKEPTIENSKSIVDFIDNKYSVDKYDCQVWTSEKIECATTDKYGSSSMSYDRKTGEYKRKLNETLGGMKRNYSTVGVCKVIKPRTNAEMMQPPPGTGPVTQASGPSQDQSDFFKAMQGLSKEYTAYIGMPFGTREREDKANAYKIKVDGFVKSEQGKRVDGWTCYSPYIVKKQDFSEGRNEFFCLNGKGNVFQNINLKVKPTTKILFDKIYKDDQIKFSGVIDNLGQVGSPTVNIEVVAESIESIN